MTTPTYFQPGDRVRVRSMIGQPGFGAIGIVATYSPSFLRGYGVQFIGTNVFHYYQLNELEKVAS